MNLDKILNCITDNLKSDFDESGIWAETGHAYEALQREFPKLGIEKIESILEIVKDRVEISSSKSLEETGWEWWVEYYLDDIAEKLIKEVLVSRRKNQLGGKKCLQDVK